MLLLFHCLPATVVSQPLLAQPQSTVSPLSSIEQELALGREAFDAGRYPLAVVHFQAAIERDASSVEAHYRLGQTYWRMNNTDLALVYFAKTAEMGKENATLQMSLAAFYDQVKKEDLAVEQYKKVIALSGTDEELRKTAEKRLNLVLVKQYAGAGDVDTALQLLNSMLDEYPDDLRVLQHLGFAYLLVNRFESAAAVYEEVLEQEPKSDSAHMNIAGVYEKMGNLPLAIKHFSLAAEYAGQPERVVEAKVRAGLLESQLAQESGNLEAAAEALRELLKLKPDLNVASNRLSRVYAEQGNTVAAMEVLEEALVSSPSSLDMRLNLASIYAGQQNYVDAVWELMTILNVEEGNTAYGPHAKQLTQQIAANLGDKFNEIVQAAQTKNNLIAHLRSNPDDAQAHFELGAIYTKQRHYEKAKIQFEHVLRIQPNHMFSHLYLGEVASFIGDYKLASESFGRYLSLETDLEKTQQLEIPYLSTLVRHLMAENKPSQALDQLERLVVLAPGDAYAWYQIGLLLAQKGAMNEAIDAYDKVLVLVPNNSLARFNRGLVYEQIGREHDALVEYQQVTIDEKKASPLKDAAIGKVKLLKARLNGLTTSATYSFSYDDNSNLSQFKPAPERTSGLTANFSYRYRYDDDWLVGLSYSPSYTMYHVAHTDYLNLTVSPTLTYGKRGDLWTLSYRMVTMENLLSEIGVSTTSNASVAWDTILKSEAQLGLNLGLQRYKGAATSRFDSNTYTFSASYSRSLDKGISDGLTYNFTYLDSLNKENDDADYVGNGLSYNLSKWFSQKLAVSGSFSVSRNLYLETDRFTRFGGVSTIPPTKRMTTLYGLSASLTYRESDTFRFFSTLNYQVNKSNLPVLVYVRGNGNDIPDVIRPMRSDELVGVPLTSSSLGEYNKMTLSFGVSVSF